ncbi:3' exoribonuclease family, domain 1 protein [Clavispora lusitaniae]|uniref:Exoribonuclease phosphorolytic domain-containing protein n=1 Tax=Clavispora lusitaniae (strain ATCC 42720) TaxID=306902 RepID=C4Y1H3_CLAL4|nr:uncharacterized protein CLUG_02055 [Clavispora lusitaniae ATCC 42720]EEQ37932.1 hypothetical protein CLUG_02055 [Clavispora lusitaniae ATCC 42720]KAF7583134.1 3' exoribonuclease family, domain 1 protein [Clavispora lusitaniae]
MSSLFHVELSPLSQVDGSARLTAGNTKVVVSVTGPIEPKPRQELPTQASLEIVVRPSRGLAATKEKVLEDLLRSVLQSAIVRYKYPRQLIQVVVQFLATDVDAEGVVLVSGDSAGGETACNELSAALNCCFFALVDANVALFNSFAAVALAVAADGALVPNPPLRALKTAASHHVVCFDVRSRKASKLLLAESSGSFSEQDLLAVVERASTLCEEIHTSYQRPAVERKVEADFVWAASA